MALRQQITNGVNAAFTAVQDLAVDVNLSLNENVTYTFGTGNISENARNITVRGIFLTQELNTPEGLRSVYRVLVRVSEVADITIYDTITVTAEDNPWRGSYRVEATSTDSFVHTITVSGGSLNVGG